MLPSAHVIFGAICSLILYLIFPQIGLTAAAVIFLSSFLIDVDHYLYYSIKFNDWNLKNAYRWFIHKSKKWRRLTVMQREKYQRILMVFHGIECLAILVLLILVHKIFLFILLGFLIHLLLDFVDLIRENEPLYSKSSQIYTYIKNKNKKKAF